MRKALLFVAILAFTGNCLAQSQANPTAFGPGNAWQAPASLASGAKACGNPSDGRKYADCFMAQMTKAGASPAAVNFTREFYKDNHEIGIMTGFTHFQTVGIAWVVYPLHQPSNYGLFLINGDPRFVNAEDLSKLDQKGMEQSFQFRDLKSLFPKVAIYPGNRDGRTWPDVQYGSDGSLQFIVGYPLRNGCPTCSNAGRAIFTWNFTHDGKFTGTSFMGMTPAPLSSPVSSPQ